MIALRQRSRAELDRCMLLSLNTRGKSVVRMRRAKIYPRSSRRKRLVATVPIWLRAP